MIEGLFNQPNYLAAKKLLDVSEEMVDLISASRAHEANLSAVKTARSMALQTLSIGKR
ncbi:MAG TPA: flagellar basal body rod C-terminal domain-containing protein [Verrucomicrobiae bacterium]|nr:flagellar basal body rod C-terminal domain-containing protein [Verrucomicrobiae bacterium]